MGYRVSFADADRIIAELGHEYRVFAPKRLPRRGWKTGADVVRYAEVNTLAEIVHDVRSDYSPKDVLYPIIQTMFYFDATNCRESDIDTSKGILVFARACDVNGIRRLDKIFLENGGNADNTYQRMRERIKIVLLECRDGWDNCFCVTMGANRTDEFSAAVRFEADSLLVDVRDQALQGYFAGQPTTDFSPEFVQTNKKTVNLPVITSPEQLKSVYALPLWQTFNDKCVGCGSCTAVCISCSCFDTTDVIYNETSREGERRRVWSSCMLEEFTTMAGGHNVRKTAGDRMRFKVLHKVYDFKARFGDHHMCVGCGRCDTRCPEEISLIDTINSLSQALETTVVSGGEGSAK